MFASRAKGQNEKAPGRGSTRSDAIVQILIVDSLADVGLSATRDAVASLHNQDARMDRGAQR
jgi:hypothetical protein